MPIPKASGSGNDPYVVGNAYTVDSQKVIQCNIRDITARKQAEMELHKSETKYASYIENAPDGVFVVNENGRYVEVNNAASQITGYSKEQLLHMSIGDITAEESLEAAIGDFNSLLKSGRMYSELQYKHKNGSTRWWSVNAVSLTESRFLGFAKDITDKVKAYDELRYLGYHDFLTGLYNRRFFEEETKRLDVEDELPLSIIMGDIDGLKLINDAFGHAEGDKLILDTAEIIREHCRNRDIPTRTGGDEFSIILPKTDSKTAYEMIGLIKNACLAHNMKISNEAFHINISLGYGTKESVGIDLNKTIKTAEEYMYQRKLLVDKSSHSTIISSIKATMLEKSYETEAHAARMVFLSRKVGAVLGLSDIQLDHLELLVTLHDIGKVGISDKLLNKPGKLSEEEWVEMKKHPAIGYRIAMSSPELIPIADNILSHHERWDGRGYPSNLAGEDIPLLSRILAVADAFDAMTNDRPYRKAMTNEAAINEIEKNAGTQFDPDIVRIFLDSLEL